MFPMPDMVPHGRGGRGCGRGRGLGRGCPRMGRGGMGRPDPRWMTFGSKEVQGGPHGRPDPRQMPFESWGQVYTGCNIFGHHSYVPWTGPQDMLGMPSMSWAGHFDMAGPPRMPFGGPCGGRGGGRPLNSWRLCKLLAKLQETCDDIPSRKAENTERNKEANQKNPEQGIPTEHCANLEQEETHDKQEEECYPEEHMRTKCDFGRHPSNRSRFMRRLRQLVSVMEETSGSSSYSDTEQPQDTTNEGKNHNSENTKFYRKEYRQAWRRFMRRQMQGCPHAFYGGGPLLPPWISSAPSDTTPSHPMGARPILYKLHRLLTAMEDEAAGHQTEEEKDQASKTKVGKNTEASDSTHPQARLQARLRRLIDHIEHQYEDNFAVLPVYPGMLWKRGRQGCGMTPCHRRRMFMHMPFGGPCGDHGCGQSLNSWHFRKLLTQIQETCRDTPSSNIDTDEAHGQGKERSEEIGDGSNMKDAETKDKQSAKCCQERHFRNKPVFGRPRFMRRLRRLMAQMDDTSGSESSSDSDSEQLQDAKDEEKTPDSEKMRGPRNECHRAWRQSMHRQMHGCPRAFYGGGPPQAWTPTWVSPVPCGPTQGRPMVPHQCCTS